MISGYVFFDRHWRYVTRLLSRNIASQISVLSEMIEKSELPLHEIRKDAYYKFNITCNSVTRIPKNLPSPKGIGMSIFQDALSENMENPYVWDTGEIRRNGILTQ